jgi:hypothetical protein
MAVATIRQATSGNLIVTMTDGTTESELTEKLGTIHTATRQVNTSIAAPRLNERWYKLAVHGIPTSQYPDSPDGMRLLQEEIERSNGPVTLAEPPRYMTTAEKRVGKEASSVVIAVRTAEELALLKRKRVMVLFEPRRVTEYHSARRTDQCRRCLLFGHHYTNCTGPQGPTCGICGQNHPTDDHACNDCPQSKGKRCEHTRYHCKNCADANLPDLDHPGFSKQCPVRIRIFKEAWTASQNPAAAPPNPADRDTEMNAHV